MVTTISSESSKPWWWWWLIIELIMMILGLGFPLNCFLIFVCPNITKQAHTSSIQLICFKSYWSYFNWNRVILFVRISICKWIYKPMVLFHLMKKKSMKDWTINLELTFTATASAVFHWLSSLDNSEVLVWIIHFQAALHN